MGRRPCCEKIGLNRGPWTMEEDLKLTNFILSHGIQCWRLVPKLAGLQRCGKSCRLRWVNYLRPDLRRGALSEAEEDQIIELHSRLGNRWSKIAAHFPGRTDNEIKNHWNTRIKKKLKKLGVDPKPTEKQKSSKGNNKKKGKEVEPKSSITQNDASADIAEEGEKDQEEERSEAGSNQATCSSSINEDDILWQSFDMEPINSEQATSAQQEEDVQSWIDYLESLMFSDAVLNPDS